MLLKLCPSPHLFSIRSLKDVKGVEIFKADFYEAMKDSRLTLRRVNGFNEKKKLILKRTERDCFTRIMY